MILDDVQIMNQTLLATLAILSNDAFENCISLLEVIIEAGRNIISSYASSLRSLSLALQLADFFCRKCTIEIGQESRFSFCCGALWPIFIQR